MTNILLLEDDLIYSGYLINLLCQSLPYITVRHAQTVQEAKNLVQTESFDLLVLDVDLRNSKNRFIGHIENGIDFAEYFRKLPGNAFTWIVFVSAHTSFLSESFSRSHCYDYIIKPIEPNSFIELIENLLTYKVFPISEKKYLSINRRNYLLRIKASDIDFIEIFGKQSTVYTKDFQHVISRFPLKEILKQLPTENFIQCHRSYIVNKDKISNIFLERTCWFLRLHNRPEVIPVGKSYTNVILNRQYDLIGGDNEF
ncbi:LytTR family DNA-binding domain-containing protein [Desulfosporosinus sp. OT]|uniref:LytR/AlgR family response regulator transcription factor n=1 Tax=Desulfosporosinus sp. OT TaxID=913865 RepID=UPI000223ACE8|nr:LytTR family DNA-binding domain-containing protein [Desulfosporosinus sp. OT]EGW36230.1 response regulator [Desulfosporosinus sp. OT]